MKKEYHGIGLMSGTSLDGIDLAYCRFTESDKNWTFELLHAETVDLDPKWHDRLVCLPEQDAVTFAKTHVYLGHYLGQVTADFIARNQLSPQFVASHGQTIFHQPDKNFTTQIGDGETLVTYLPCPLVANFRNKDVALGGQGAPLVPFGEKYLFPENRLFLNLGGFSNLTVAQADGDRVAFDVCACNMALNWLVKNIDPSLKYDEDGKIAFSGQLNEGFLAALNAMEYYAAAPPKSLGAEWFEAVLLPLLIHYDLDIPDKLHTYTRHIAIQVAAALRSLNVQHDELVITGGGAHNSFLLDEIEAAVSKENIRLKSVDAQVIDYKEAIIFAFLGLNTLLGRANVLPEVTGSRQGAPGGSIHLPVSGWPLRIL